MPRPERPLDSDDAELLRFAADLRLLREKAGKPTYRELSKVAHYSVTVLSEAASGRKLPSLAVTTAYVHACGGDVEQWRRRWHDVADGAKPADPEREPPYLGLGAFQAADSDRFFGREKLVGQLLDKVSERPFVGVFGASGSGKSSLLRAGLVAARPADVFSPGPHPMQAWGETTADLVVIDQFEEVFTLCRDEDERVAFIDAITSVAGKKVVIDVRSDFYGHCGRYPALVDALHDAQILVGAMSPQELRRAITEPALRAGYTVEGALVSVLEAEHAPLPLVSHALLETWRRRRGTRLTVAGYEETGGVRHALAQSAEAAYLELDPGQQALARKIFLRLTALGEGTEDTKRRVSRESLDNDDETLFVLDHLARARLITLDDTGVDLTHEAVIRSWPRLSGWLTANRDGLRVHHQLTEATATWESLNRDSGALYRGVRLALAREWAAGDADAMSARERRFLNASVEAEEAEQEAARRTTRRLRQLVALLTVLLVLAVTAVGFAISAQRESTAQRNMALARQAVRDAQTLQNSESSRAAQLSLAAHELTDNAETRDNLASAPSGPHFTHWTAHTADIPATSVHGTTLATTSWDRSVKLWDIADHREPVLLGTTSVDHEPLSLEFSKDGRLLAVADERAVTLFDATDPRHPQRLGVIQSPADALLAAAMNHDGTLVVTTHNDGSARLWDITDPRNPVLTHTLPGHDRVMRAAAFRPDGRAFAVASRSSVVLYSLDGTPERKGELIGHSQAVQSLAFSPDGRTIGTGSWDQTARLWDAAELTAPRSRAEFTGSNAIVWGVSFSPDGATFAATGDAKVRLWSVDGVGLTGAPRKLGTVPGGIYSAEFTPDGTTLVIVESRTVRLQELREMPLFGHENNVSSVSFRPDGQVLSSSSWDGTVRLWRMTAQRTREPLARITDATGFARSAAFSPDGRWLAAASDDSWVRIYDVTDPAAPRLKAKFVPLADQPSVSVAFSPDGRTLAVGSFKVLTLWDITNLDQPQELFRREAWYAAVWTVTWNPDGTRIVAGTGNQARLFDATNLRELKEITFSGNGDNPLRGGFSQDGRLLLTGHGDTEVRLIDTATLREAGKLTGFGGVAYTVAFHGTRIAISHADAKIRLWDVTDPARPRLEMTYSGHTGDVPALAWSPDGTYLASGGNDTTVRLWEIGLDRAVARLCAHAPAPLTPEQWETNFPGVPYRRFCR
ncbi:hypothetical protein FXN61_04095 [Lentzea sp. PSKA42]|uniref:HTH cro/C1-type domain-containing protein n=1 Tax=Lentzea indica TaxID=2604800 RepID=A0ABX1FB43_9PSEU|nr:PD40 domain-containing protein [Lentzea indica]NKE56052.1 hypothetical protein [Lentzea indica]